MEKRYISLYIFAKKSIFDVKKKIPIGLFYVGPIYVNTVQYLYRFFQRRFIMVKSLQGPKQKHCRQFLGTIGL